MPISKAEVDEYGVILDSLKNLSARAEQLKAMMATEIPLDHPASEPISFTGEQYVVQFSACSWERTITNIRKVYKLLGFKKFMDACSFTLKNLDALTTEEDRKRLVNVKQSGPRRISVARKILGANLV